MLTYKDFFILGDLWRQGCYFEVAAKLKEWEREDKDETARILYRIWFDRLFGKRYSREALEFERRIKRIFEEAGLETREAPIIDFLAIDDKGRRAAIECKNSNSKAKIYEGIGQLLYYKWKTRDDKSALMLVIPKRPEGDAASIIAFARSLGICILYFC